MPMSFHKMITQAVRPSQGELLCARTFPERIPAPNMVEYAPACLKDFSAHSIDALHAIKKSL